MSLDDPQALSDYVVPTRTLAARVACADGSTLDGRLFLPGSTSLHAGPMRPDERLNDDSEFFPFLPEGRQRPVILNKRQVVSVSFDANESAGSQELSAGEFADESATFSPPERRVVIECAGFRLAGALSMETPEHQRRVLDYLNRPERFLVVRDGDSIHLVNRRRIVSVSESAGD